MKDLYRNTPDFRHEVRAESFKNGHFEPKIRGIRLELVKFGRKCQIYNIPAIRSFFMLI